MSKKTKKIVLAIGIVALPYLFILLAGILVKLHFFQAYNSIYIIIGAGIIMVLVAVYNILYWKKNAKEKESEEISQK